jgi:nicotinate-nucleotide adenylyltransferase
MFGGSFDPPTLAHTTLPPLAARLLECDEIVYVPANVNPLKAEHPPAPAEHRLEMLKLALKGTRTPVPSAAPSYGAGTARDDAAPSQARRPAQVRIETLELDRPGPSFTIDTLDALRRRFGATARLFLLLGVDQALEFHRWKDWQRILELATPAVMLRPPWDEKSFATRIESLRGQAEAARWAGWVIPLGVLPAVEASSTEARRRLAAQEPTDHLIDPEVHRYAESHRLYRGAGAK